MSLTLSNDRKYRLAPSLLSADFVILQKQIDELLENGIDELHLDIMDGDFVPALTFADPVIRSIRKHYPDVYLDAHLMIDEPGRFIKTFADAGADNITVHIEACKHIDRVIQAIKAEGVQAGVSLNPGTALNSIYEILPVVDRVLIMSVNPGFGGQKYIDYCTDKGKRLSEMRSERNLNFTIQIDGGVTPEKIEFLSAAGVTDFVAGSAVFKGDITKNCKAFKEAMK